MKKILIALLLLLTTITIFNWSNSNLISDTSDNTNECSRTEPYSMPSEFQRARSLRKQRINEARQKIGMSKLNEDFYNCIDIEYKDLNKENAEGMFYFDQNSSLERLVIYVDSSYKAKDDLLTAILLSHEFTHITQLIRDEKAEELSCIEKEGEAFYNQLRFILTLNREERSSLYSRLKLYSKGQYKNPKVVSMFETIINLLEFNMEVANVCQKKYKTDTRDFTVCLGDGLKEKIDNMIESSSYYKKQCNI